MISVKAHWEWCSWNCDLRVTNAWKNGMFCRTESVAMTPNSRDHMPAMSLWGVAAKWPTRAPKTKLILCPRGPQGYSRISQAGFWKSTGTSCQLRSKPHAVFHGVCEVTLTEVLATQVGVMRRSKKVRSFELYELNPLSPHCGSIARELMHCYTWGRLRIVTVHGNTVGRHS